VDYSGVLESIMRLDKNIRFTLICDMYGNTVCCKHRDGVQNYLTDRETQEALYQSAQMWNLRRENSKKIGQGRYAFVEYEKICRFTMPFGEDRILLVTCDINENPMKIVKPIFNQIAYPTT
jgi:hypothetical protein